jgi:hypothetical protein
MTLRKRKPRNSPAIQRTEKKTEEKYKKVPLVQAAQSQITSEPGGGRNNDECWVLTAE